MTNLTDIELPSQEDVRADLRSVFLGAIRVTLESLLEEEIRSVVGAYRWQRLNGRKGYRNGSYLRSLITSMEHLDLNVPRSREHGSASQVLGRYQRSHPGNR